MQYLFSLVLLILINACVFAQSADSTKSNNQILGGDLTLDYTNPKEYEIGNIRIEGADYFDHQAIKVIAGIRPGSKIKIPGIEITEAVKNLWKEGLFYSIEIGIEKEINFNYGQIGIMRVYIPEREIHRK